MNTVYLGLGGNIGDREDNINAALKRLTKDSLLNIKKKSSIIETPPLIGGPVQGDYLNIVVAMETSLSAYELLALIGQIEDEGGRSRNLKWGPRTIDIDILLFNDEIIDEKDLKVPHPEMTTRIFVMTPLAEIHGSGVHPIVKKSFEKMNAELLLITSEQA